MNVIGLGALAGDAFGPAALSRRLPDRFPGHSCPPEQDGAEALKAFVTAFKRQTRQRYIDKAAEAGLKALHDAAEDAGLTQARIDADPVRIGILVATALGPVDTRAQYLGSYAQRGGKSVSATLFSNCGYNIVGAMLARSLNVRGPVLTFGATGDWPATLLDSARRLFAGGRVDALLVGRAEAGEAVFAVLTGADDAAARLSLAQAPAAGGGASGYRISGAEVAGLAVAPSSPDDFFWHLAVRWWAGDAADPVSRETLRSA